MLVFITLRLFIKLSAISFNPKSFTFAYIALLTPIRLSRTPLCIRPWWGNCSLYHYIRRNWISRTFSSLCWKSTVPSMLYTQMCHSYGVNCRYFCLKSKRKLFSGNHSRSRRRNCHSPSPSSDRTTNTNTMHTAKINTLILINSYRSLKINCNELLRWLSLYMREQRIWRIR